MTESELPPKVNIGDMVLYHYMGPLGRGAGVPHPAVVVATHNDGTLDLTEFRAGTVEHRRGVKHSADPAPFSWRLR